MAAMSTSLTEFSSFGDSITYAQSGHTVLKPSLVIQKRKVPSGAQTVAESSVAVVQATEDADGNVIPQKVTMTVVVRSPINGKQTDVDAALAVLRDIVAGDEFGNTVATQEPLV